jgi:hypothetical protein
MKGLIFGVFLFFLPSACGKRQDKPEVVIAYPNVTLSEKPGIGSKALGRLPEGETLRALGEVSDFFTLVELDGIPRETPWIRVQTRSGRKGWVYAWYVRPVQGDPEQWLIEQNIKSLLGEQIAARRRAWQTRFNDSAGAVAVEALYKDTRRLQAEVSYKLANRPEAHEMDYQPNLEWLPAQFPGMVFEWPSDDKMPAPRIDYGFFARKASHRKDASAGLYFSFCVSVFPHDSIESAFPVWKMPLSENASCSRLGSGIHRTLLKSIDSALEKAPEFQAELRQWKEAVLEDIAGRNVAFWYSAASIRSELDDILAAPPACLTKSDIIALTARRKHFEYPEANGFRTDLRSGRTDAKGDSPN